MRPAGRAGNPRALDHQRADTDDQTRQFGPKDLKSLSLRRKVLQTVFLSLSLVKKESLQTARAGLLRYGDLIM